MAYSKDIYMQAEAELNRRKTTAETNAELKLRAFYDLCPEAERIRAALATTGSHIAKAVLRGSDVRASLESLKTQNLALQERFNQLLKSYDLTRDDIEPQYTCRACEDTGYVDGRICSCHRTLLRQITYDQLNQNFPLQLSSFADFSLDYYSASSANHERSDREQMKRILEHCKQYAETFSRQSRNLMMIGRTGLGKTHLSLAIAAAVIEKGYGVMYGNAQSYAAALERERFSSGGEEGGSTFQLLTECDLLVLDDLGMEYPSAYVTSMICALIDMRLSAHRPTIISTNCAPNDLYKRFDERLTSRIGGFYDILHFCGGDIRVKRYRESRNTKS